MTSKHTTIALTACLALGGIAFAHGNKPGEAKLDTPKGSIVIEYTGPALKGRDFNAMIKQPGANPWRLGADRATTLSTPGDLQFGDAVLAAGKYVLRAYLDDSEKWWLQAYDSDRNVVGKLSLEATEAEESKENMEISLSGSAESAQVTIQWGTQTLSGQFSVAD